MPAHKILISVVSVDVAVEDIPRLLEELEAVIPEAADCELKLLLEKITQGPSLEERIIVAFVSIDEKGDYEETNGLFWEFSRRYSQLMETETVVVLIHAQSFLALNKYLGSNYPLINREKILLMPRRSFGPPPSVN